MNRHKRLHTLASHSSSQFRKIIPLGHAVTAVIIGLASLLFTGCAPMGGGGGSTRTLGHVYQDDRGMTIINLFDMGGQARGVVQTIGHRDSRMEVTLSLAEFESLWGRFDESKLARYAVKSHSDKFTTKDNYVIVKGIMPNGTTTYVIPRSEAPENVRKWVRSFREKMRSWPDR